MRRQQIRRICVGVIVVITLGTGFIWIADFDSAQHRTLPDGSVLTLNRVRFSDQFEFVHGTALQRILRRVIPAGGIRIGKFKLDPPVVVEFDELNRSYLGIELRVDAKGGQRSMVTTRSFSRPYRGTLIGEDGFEYTQEWPREFRPISGQQCAYLLVSSFPRDSRRLRLRVDERQTPEGPWRPIAEFDFRNPGRPKRRGWMAGATNVNVNEQLAFIIGDVTVEQKPFNPIDIWTQTVSLPFQARNKGALLTNWIPAYVKLEDNTGNHGLNSRVIGFENDWIIRRGWRGPDPRQVWKVDVDFEWEPNQAAGNVFVIPLASVLPGPSVTNLAKVNVTFSGGSNDSVNASIPTNRTDVALRFVAVRTRNGREITSLSGSWNQHRFRMLLDSFPAEDQPAEVILAIIPTYHATFFIQPRVIHR